MEVFSVAAAAVGFLIVVFSFFLMFASVDAGLVGVAIGLVVLIFAAVAAQIKKSRGRKKEVAPDDEGYADDLRRHIVEDGRLSDADAADLAAEFCRMKKTPRAEVGGVVAALLQERAAYAAHAPQNVPAAGEKTDEAFGREALMARLAERKRMVSEGDAVEAAAIPAASEDWDDEDADLEILARRLAAKKRGASGGTAAARTDRYSVFYEDAGGNKTRREIDVVGFSESGGRLYVIAWCHLRGAWRSFLPERMIRLFDSRHREILQPSEYFWRLYGETDEGRLAAFFRSHDDELAALVFLARADGSMRKNEREVIAGYVRASLPDVDPGKLDDQLKNLLSVNMSEFKKIIKNLAGKPEGEKIALIGCAEEIYGLKKNPDAMETGIFQKIKEILKKRK